MPKYIGDIKNPTYENIQINWEDGPKTRTSSKPNIIVVLVDDLGFNQISSYGGGMANGQFKTPNIDKLAKDGVLCTNGYSSSPVCSPSRAALLTEFTALPKLLTLVSLLLCRYSHLDGNFLQT